MKWPDWVWWYWSSDRDAETFLRRNWSIHVQLTNWVFGIGVDIDQISISIRILNIEFHYQY